MDEREVKLQELEKSLGLSFLNRQLFNQSLSHSSYAYEMKSKDILDNERLEFLGDAVIKLVTSEYLYNKFPEKAEGDLTKIRADVISDRTLAAVSRKLRLGSFMLLGQNEKKTGGKSRRSNLANVFEALVGAIYLDAGLGKARDFLLDQVGSEIEKVSRAGFIRDYKSALQELVQQNKWGLPQYHVIREVGPKHKKVFLVEVKIRGRAHGAGKGLNKKDAEQRAAFEALQKLKGNSSPHRANAAKESGVAPAREGARAPGEGRKAEGGIGGMLSRVRRRFSR